ncbi:tryptase-related [Holotrichia oblita]|uniref:Tryptase-related n=1 Tax=Holotrichia oblita TaxID=644536 RepID=A0ACB9T6L1_HOLOL|nr:tryptase-related [Holotrichia oblita]
MRRRVESCVMSEERSGNVADVNANDNSHSLLTINAKTKDKALRRSPPRVDSYRHASNCRLGKAERALSEIINPKAELEKLANLNESDEFFVGDGNNSSDNVPSDDSITNIYINNAFTNDTFKVNIVILLLSQEVTPNMIIGPACLPISNNIYTHQTCIVAGWGDSSFVANDRGTTTQRQVNIRIVDDATCRRSMIQQNVDVEKHLDRLGQIWAGGESSLDACTQDGGSPLICLAPATNKYTIVGIVIWGKGCGQEGVYGVYTNVAYYRNWIDNALQTLTGRNLDNGEWVYSINQCLQDFRQRFPNLPITYAQLLSHVHACIDKFQETGAVTRKPGRGAPKKRTAACIEDIRQRMDNSPKKSIPKLSQQVQLSVGTCHTILKKDLKLYPYKIQAVHELTQKRKLIDDESFLRYTIIKTFLCMKVAAGIIFAVENIIEILHDTRPTFGSFALGLTQFDSIIFLIVLFKIDHRLRRNFVKLFRMFPCKRSEQAQSPEVVVHG